MAPIVNSSTPVDVVRSSRRPSVDQTAPSGATVAWSAAFDLERDRLTAEGEQGGLRCRRRDDDQTVAPDSRDGVGLGERGHRQPGAEPECRRIDQSGFGVRAVEEVGAAGTFGDRDRRTVRRGVEPDQCLTAVTVGENDATGRLVHEPSRGSRRRRVDCGQPI